MKTAKNHMEYVLGLTPHQFDLLEFLRTQLKDGKDVSRKELHQILKIDSATIARNLSKLIELKLITREYALSESAPPHYRYKTYPSEYYQEYVQRVTSEMLSLIETYLNFTEEQHDF
jgi:predicted transcriptional regulator